MPWDKFFGQTRRTFLKTAVAAGVLSNTSTVRAQEELFEFGATTQGWQARQPARLRGAVNPPLDVWGTHEIVWENEDGEPHGLVVEDDAGNIIDQTDVVSTQGATRSVTVSADLTANPPSPARYYCPEHPETMAGTFRVHEYAVYRDGTASVTFTDGESDGSTVTVDSVDFQFTAGFVAIYEGEPFEGLDTEQATNVYGEQSDDLFLGVSDSLHMGEHTDVEVPLETPLEAGEERTLAVIPYVSPERELENSTPYQEPYGYIEIDLATVTVGDPSEEIDAEILAFETDGGTVEPGDVVESTVIVENTGDVEHTFFVGYSMFSADGQEFHNEGETGTSVTLEPGEQETVAVTWIVPEDAPTMTYDAVTAVWKESSAAELDTQLDRAENEATINIEEKTDTELIADFTILTEDPVVGEETEFDASDSEGPIEEYRWDVTGDSDVDTTGEVITYEFDEPGEYEVTLTVVDSEGNEATDQQLISVSYAEAPEIHAETIEIDPIAVETSSGSGLVDRITGGNEEQRPTLSAVIENAEETWVNVVVNGEHRDSVQLEKKDDDLWETADDELPINGSPGTRVDLEIETWNNTLDENETVSQSTFDNDYIRENDNLGYFLFNKVFDVAVVLGRFEENDPNNIFVVKGINHEQWLAAERIDINYYYGSSRGSMGAVGFNITHFDNDGDFYEVDSQKRYEKVDALPGKIEELFDDPVEPPRGREFLDDLREKAERDVNFEEFDLWVGRHPSWTILEKERRILDEKERRILEKTTLDDLTILDDLIITLDDTILDDITILGYMSPEAPRVFVPFWPSKNDHYDFGAFYGTFIHELGHAWGAQHLYDKGNVQTECVMGEAPPGGRGNFIPDAPPLSTALRLSNYFELDLTDTVPTSDKIYDWLTVADELGLKDLQDGGDDITIPALKQYQLEDDITIINPGSIGTLPGKYIIEYRQFLEGYDDGEVQWHPTARGGAVVYHWQDPLVGISYNTLEEYQFLEENKRFLIQEGDTLIDTIGVGTALMIEFELDNKGRTEDENQASVRTQLGSGPSNMKTVTLRDQSESPDLFELFHSSMTVPNLNLKIVDSEGRIVGINDEGEYVTEIPDARSSGKRIGGLEWITIPDDIDVNFVVSSQDTQAFLEELPNNADENDEWIERMQTDYWISVTQYGDNPEVIRENDILSVSDATTRVTQETIEPGEEQRVEIRNDRSDCDIVEINPDSDPANEYIVFLNTGDIVLDLSGWRVESPDGRTYVFPDGFTLEPGATVTLYTGSGTDTESNLYWEEDEPVWEEGDEVIIQDSEEETRLNVWYDERQVIYYDEPPEPEEDDDGLFDVDLPEWTPFAGAAGIGLGTAGYLYGRYLRRKDSDDERTE